MFQRSWVRLSAAFAAMMAIFAVVVLVLFFYFINPDRLVQTTILNNIRDSVLPEQIVRLYERDQSWDTLAAWLGSIESVVGVIQDTPTRLILADADGQIVYAPTQLQYAVLSEERLEYAIVLRSEGELVGYIDIDRGDWQLSESAEELFVQEVQRTISIIMGVASVIGIIWGIVISRTLTAPLNRLAHWAEGVKDNRNQKALDITGSIEVRSLIHTINEMVDALQTSELLRRNLVADVAHELRTPLTVLQGNLYAILDDVYPCDKTQVAALYDQTRVLSRLVNDLHDLSQFESNQTSMQMQYLQIDTLIQDVAEQFQFKAEEKQIDLRCSLPDSLSPIVGDSERLYQVLNNLMSNATRHTPHGEYVEISAAQHEDEIIIQVTNSGSEIPEEHLPHIFERFYRADRARYRSQGGAGLGLAIVRAIIEAHHGQISVTSVGQVTSFKVVLPVSEGVASNLETSQ